MPAISPEVFGNLCHAKMANECHAWDKWSKMLPLGTLKLTETVMLNFDCLYTFLIRKI